MKHAVPDAQARLPGQGAATGVPQVPLPLHSVSLVSIEVATAHETGTEQAVFGYTQAPVAGLQPMAPQVPPMGAQAAVQQLPVPVVPHTPLEH